VVGLYGDPISFGWVVSYGWRTLVERGSVKNSISCKGPLSYITNLIEFFLVRIIIYLGSFLLLSYSYICLVTMLINYNLGKVYFIIVIILNND
jgi:hypothetical protein